MTVVMIVFVSVIVSVSMSVIVAQSERKANSRKMAWKGDAFETKDDCKQSVNEK